MADLNVNAIPVVPPFVPVAVNATVPQIPFAEANILNDEDLNGECFLAGSQGEVEEVIRSRQVIIPEDIVLGVPLTNVQAHTFLRRNYNHAKSFVTDDANGRMLAFKIAYIRFLALRNGHFKFTHSALQHHCQYSDFKIGAVDAQLNAAVLPDANYAPNVLDTPIDAGVYNGLTAWRRDVRRKYTDMVCTVAYFFRVRGHHYTDEMAERYNAVWRKTLREEDNPGLEWKYIAHECLHAIFPDDLDEIWREAVDTGKCAGALVKRFKSYPAGVAGLAALKTGANDLRMVVPRAFDHVVEGVVELERCVTIVSGNRWAGSVNRRFYDAPELLVNEQALGALAAVIRASLEQFAPASKLLKSKALERIAGNAPMTGAVVARMIATAVKSDQAAAAFVPIAVQDPYDGNANTVK